MRHPIVITGLAAAVLTGCGSQSPPAAAPVPAPAPINARQPEFLSFGQSTDMRSGVTVTVAAPKLANFPYPSMVHPGEVGVQLPITAHNDRDTSWVGCSYLYTYVGLPTGEQVQATGVADSGPSHDGPVSPGATANCTMFPKVPANWVGQEVTVRISIGEPGVGIDSAPNMDWRGPLS